MRKRPFVLTILALFHFVYPIYYTVQVLYYHHIPFKYIWPLLKILFNPFQQFPFFFLAVTAIVIGYGLFKVRAWAYWLFIVYALYTIALNIHHYAKFGEHDLIPPSIRISAIIFTFLVMFYFVRKHIRAPYFNPRLRWWENAPRYKVEDIRAKFRNVNYDNASMDEGEIFDLSESGAFVTGKIMPELGVKLNMTFKLLGEVTIGCLGDVVWVCEGKRSRHPKGFGVMFTDILKNDKRQIRAYLKSLSKELAR